MRNPVLLRPAPLGSIELQPESASSFCVDMSYDDRAALDQEFPSDGGTYRFEIDQADGATVKIPVVWDDAPPGGSIAYTAPDDGANVPANEDLMVTWDLDLGAPECSVPGDCGDFIGFFLVDDGLDEDVVVEPALPITTTGQTVDGADLDAGAYSIETETYVGVFAESATDGTSDDYLFSRANEDINLINITVPEPGAALLGVAAFATLGILGQRRRQPRQKA